MKIQDIKSKIENKNITLSTTTQDNRPYSIIVELNEIMGNQIIITNNYMKTTVENLEKNPNICLAFYDGENGWRISGKAKHYSSGKWLEFVKSLEENNGFAPKGALVIDVEEVKELG